MIVRNAHTGALHEVPDHQLYEVGEAVYDGFGNPVGGIFDDIVKGVGSLVSAPVQAATSLISPIAGAAGNILGGLLPRPPMPAAAPAFAAPATWPGAGYPLTGGGFYRPPVGGYPGAGFRPPWPSG